MSLETGPQKKAAPPNVAEPLVQAMPALDQAAAGAGTFVMFRRKGRTAGSRIIRAAKIDANSAASAVMMREVSAWEEAAQAACAAGCSVQAVKRVMAASSFPVLQGL